MVMYLLSFVKGSKSAEGGKNPLADMDPGGPNLGHRPLVISSEIYICRLLFVLPLKTNSTSLRNKRIHHFLT